MFGGSVSMSFHTLNHLHVLGKTYSYTYTHGIVRSKKLTLALSTSSSSILVNINESANNPRKGGSITSILTQSNAIGIIGGVSPESTLHFLQKLEDCVPYVLCSDPHFRQDLLNYERSCSPSLYSRTRPCNVDDTPIVEELNRKREFLEQGGARCIVMPCHLLHLWHEEVVSGCNVPILHMAECVARELKEAKLRPLEAGCPLRIGLVGTDAVLNSGYYQDKLQNEGFEVVLPDKATMEHTITPAIEALNRKDMEGARNLLRVALQVLLVRAVNMVIIASHEMRELLPQDDPLRKKCVDPIDALVRSTIKWSQSVEVGS